MWQTLVAYLIVIAAASWVVWTRFLPTAWRAGMRDRVRHVLGRGPVARDDQDCACGHRD